MRINTNGFTYRLMDTLYEDHRISENLCVYFWQAVLAYFIGSFMSFLVAWMGLGALFAPVQIIFWHFTGVGFIPEAHWLFPPVVIFCFVYIIAAVFWVSVGVKWCITNWCITNVFKFDNMESPKPDSVVIEYIKAKKNKFCPKIEFYDGDAP